MLLLKIFNFRISIGNGGPHLIAGHNINNTPDVRRNRDVLKTRRDSIFNEVHKSTSTKLSCFAIKKPDDESRVGTKRTE